MYLAKLILQWVIEDPNYDEIDKLNEKISKLNEKMKELESRLDDVESAQI